MATICVIICLILLSLFRVEGNTKASKLNEDENNGATFSIKTIHGEIYDCIEFSEQPAFSNPLLKNLTFESTGSNSLSLSRLLKGKAPSGVGLKGGGCPFGFVPILRIKGRQKRIDLHSNMTVISPQGDPAENNHCYAIVRTNDPSTKYYGGDGSVTIYKPTVVGPQWSASRIRLSNGPDSIEAGWMVNPGIFKDTNTHLYIRFVAGGNGCFNLECPGFVQVAKDVPIGLTATKISRRGSDGQYFWKLSIFQRYDGGDWWLTIGEDKYVIGYWPKSLFTSLTDVASQVEWGGEVYNPPGMSAPPEMGCGYKPDSDHSTSLSTYYEQVTIINHWYRFAEPPDTVEYQNCKETYAVYDAGSERGEGWGRLIFYGGPKLP